MELGVFSTASLELHVPSVNSGSDDSILHSRERVYFDEELSFELRIFLRNLDITFEQAERLFRSPALRLVAEVGYLEGSSHAAPEQQRHSSGSSSIRQQYPPAITPATAPQVSPEDTQYASLPVSQVIWSAPWETASPEDLRVSQGGDKSWMGIFRWKRVPIAFPKVPSHLLSIDITLTFQEHLDPTLPTLLERPPTPVTPPSKPKRLSSGPEFPSSEYAKRMSGVDIGSQSISAPVDMEIEEPDKEKKSKAAKQRKRRMLDEEYAFDGWSDINLLEDITLGGDQQDEFFLPASRFPSGLSAASLSLGATPSSSDRPVGHSRTRSRSVATHQRRASQFQNAGTIPVDELPTLKRAHRKVLQASSAVNVRMRTLALALNTTDSLSNSDILHSGNLDNTSGPGLTLSVEVQNPSETGLGFEIQSITVELDSVQTAKVGMTKCIKQPVFAPDFPLVLDCVSQHHFLFSLQLNDVFFDQSNVGVEEPTKELPPPTPIAAMVSPAQSLSRRHQHNVAQTSTVDASLSASQQTAGDLRQKSAFDQRKTACIVVRGRPVRRPDPYLPENSSFQPYITEVFESRWNCALDVSTLARARTEQQSTRTRAGHSRSSIRSHGQAYAPSKPENIAGDKRFTHSSLSSVSSGLADIEFDRRASLPPSISAIENMANVPFTGYSEESHHLRSLFSPQSPIDTTTAKPSPQNNDSSFEGDSLTPGFRYPIPGHPTYTEHRQDATAGPAIHPTESMAPTEKVFYRKPGAAAANMGSGLLIHVSLLSLHSQPGDPAAPFTLNAKTTSRPQSAVKQPSLGRVSSESDQSSGPDATPEEEAAGQEADDNRKRSHVRLFDTFVLEVFIMNKTSTARMFTVGVPPKRLGEEGKRGPSTEGGRGLPLHNNDISTEVGVVALEDEVLVGPLQSGTCQTVHIKFLALRPGVHSVAEMLVTDMATGQRMRLSNVLTLVVDV